MALTTYNGFVTSGSTFADVVNDSATDTTWYKIWNEDTGEFYTEGALDVSEGWVSAASLAEMELPNSDSPNKFFIKSYGSNSGQSDWIDAAVSIGSKDSYYEASGDQLDPTTSYTYDQVIDTTNLDSDAWLKVYNAEDGSYVDGGNWLKAGDLSTSASPRVRQILRHRFGLTLTFLIVAAAAGKT